MIRFICGRAGSGKSEYVMDSLKEAADSEKSVILIVPEQQAVMWESRVARELDASTALSLEVLTFTRLSDRVAREYGGFFHNCADTAAKRLIMWAAVESVRGVLTYYNTARSERLVSSLITVVKELRTYRVNPADIEMAADSLEGGDSMENVLSRKLRDIAVVYAAYDELLHQSFDEVEELSERTADTVSEKSFFKGKKVYIDSFYSVTPAQKDIIRTAMRDAEDVTITFACPEEKTDEPQFAHVVKFFAVMKQIASDFGGYEIVSLEAPKRFKKEALAVLERVYGITV